MSPASSNSIAHASSPPDHTERSGLFDIHVLSSMVDAQRGARPSASASSIALPTFARAWTMPDLRRSPQSSPPPPRRSVPSARPAFDLLLFAMVAALSLIVLLLGAYAVFGSSSSAGPDRTVGRQVTAP